MVTAPGQSDRPVTEPHQALEAVSRDHSAMHSSLACLIVALALLQVPALAQCPFDRGSTPTLGTGSVYASSLDADGSLAVVGQGVVYGRFSAVAYERSGVTWKMTDVLDGGVATANSYTDVAISGDTVMVGNISDRNDSGMVTVHQLVGGSFVQTQVLRPIVAREGAQFGRRIEIDGDRAVISAPLDDQDVDRGGAVYVFERLNGVWIETARIDPPVPRSVSFFGLGLDLDGDTLAAGRPGLTLGSAESKSTLVFREQNGTWVLEEEIDGGGSSGFGYDLALDDDRLAIGSSRHRGPVGRFGAVFLFERTGTDWALAQRVTENLIPAAVREPGMGLQVELAGDLLIAGAASAEIGGFDNVHVFERSGTTFRWRERLVGDNQFEAFGNALSLTGDDLWVGASSAPSEIPGLPNARGGHYVFDLERVASYCAPPLANSSGSSGSLEEVGCAVLTSNSAVLRASQLPPLSLTVTLVGDAQTIIPGVVGGLEVLCVGGSVGRYPATITDAQGVTEVRFDLGQVPRPATLAASVAGQSWYVQTLHRDGGSTNSTNALRVRVR